MSADVPGDVDDASPSTDVEAKLPDELPDLLKLIGLTYHKKGQFPKARAADKNMVKVNRFPTDRELLSEETIQLITHVLSLLIV